MKYSKFLILCAAHLFCFLDAFTQHEDKVKVSLPSPNNISSAQYQSVNVDYYQGVPKISIPLFSLESAAGTSIPIDLAYKASGVKLHEYASTVGMNWSLQAGGSVTRVVRGLPDESENGYIGKNNVGVQINSSDPSDPNRANKIANGEWDGEPDLFILTTPFESVPFVFDENKVPVFNQPTQLSISLVRLNGPDDNLSICWNVTDAKGNSYVFGNSDLSREIVESDSNTPVSYVSTWFLTKMNNFNQTDEVTFEYIAGANITTKKYSKVKLIFSYTGCSGPAEQVYDNDNPITYKSPKYLSRISTNIGKVVFNYSGGRLDLPGANRLTSMDVYSGSQFLKRFVLHHDYYHPPDPNPELNRLYLKDIYLIGKDGYSSLKLYGFRYFNDPANKFPTRNSVSFDHWGYYNNNVSSTPFPPLATKEPDLNKTLQYTLSEIEFGLGGKTTFEYELNTYYDNVTGVDKNSGGLRVKKIIEIDNAGKSLVKQYEYKLASGRSSGLQYVKSFVYNKESKLSFPLTSCTITGESIYNNVQFHTGDLNGASIGYSRVKVTNPDGGAEIYAFKDLSTFPDQFTIVNASLGTIYSIDNFRQFGYPTSYAYKRGLMASKTFLNAMGKKVYETIYDYASLSAEQLKSRGVSVTLEFSLSGTTVSRWYQNIYYHVKDNYRLTKETESTYDDAGNENIGLRKEKSYEYSPDGILLRRVVYNTSDGATYSKKYYYPSNRNEITGLQQEDIDAYAYMDKLVLLVREEETSIKGNKIIEHTSYKKVQGSGSNPLIRIFPSKVLKSKNGSLLWEEKTLGYDFNSGNQIFEQGKDGIPKSYLYDSDNLLIGSATNASNAEIFYENFEHSPSAIEGAAHMGTKYYPGSQMYSINFTRPNQKKYKLAYSRLINNKWELVQRDYTTDNLVLNEPYPVDDIMVYPEGTFFSTYAHFPLVGSTAQCAPGNQLTYYEYDNFQRIKTVRNRENFILTKYNYQSACDCPLPVAYATIQYRNVSSYQFAENRFEDADVYVVLKDANNNPVSVEDLTINVSELKNANGVNSTRNLTITINGSEGFLGRMQLKTEDLGPNGEIYRYAYTDYVIASGIGYIVW